MQVYREDGKNRNEQQKERKRCNKKRERERERTDDVYLYIRACIYTSGQL